MPPLSIKNRFPIFKNHPGLVYLDSAATSLKPETVIEAVTKYYTHLSANVGRGLYPLAEETTAIIEEIRAKTSAFIGASPEEIVFTRNTTESMNLVASALADRVGPGDNIVVTAMEHHSNYLPWERIARARGAEFRVIPFSENGTIELETISSFLDERTRIFAFTAVSNVLGTINPVKDFTRIVKHANTGTIVVVDAAQAIGHVQIDMTEWGCDFLAFSGHKMFGPTGIGVLFGKKAVLESLPPYQVGGGMVADACSRNPEYRPAPYRFEAGTPDIAAIIGFGAAIDFVDEIGVRNIRRHEVELTKILIKELEKEFGDEIAIYGPIDSENRGGLVSFTLKGIHPHDLAQVLGEQNICVRAGEHCAAPAHRSLNTAATIRVSFSAYNDQEDIRKLIVAARGALEMFRG